MPPMKKLMVATNDGICKLDNPMIECPEVQPPAYLVPKPTRKPRHPQNYILSISTIAELLVTNVSVANSYLSLPRWWYHLHSP